MKRQTDDQTGRVVLGRYRLVMPLAKGGQGVVYLARGEGAAGFTLPVVIKRVLTPISRDPEANERFVREARITSQLRHPDIVSILDFEQESDDSYVMVLEYVHGYDLAKWTQFLRSEQRPFDAELAAYITIRVLEALHYSHSLRSASGEPTPVVHRDVSPGNVLIDEDGHVKLTDFGIAISKVHRSEEHSSTSKYGLQGKLAYMAPEIYRGVPPSPQSDTYACAVMLHQLLIGKNEFQAKDLVSAAMRVSSHVPSLVSSLRSDVSEAAATVINGALAKDPVERPPSARELSVALRRAFNLDLGEMPERLARAVRRDFHDPRFAGLAEVMELSAIDRAWRDAPAAGPLSSATEPAAARAQRLARRTGEIPIVPDASSAADASASQKRGSLLWMAVAAVAVAAAIAFVVTRRTGREERVVFVKAEENVALAAPASGAPHPQPTTGVADGGAGSLAPADSPTAAAVTATQAEPKAHGGDSSVQLTRAFGTRRREIETCFTLHSAGLTGAPRLHVDFEISAQGRVSQAQLDPEAIENSELGRCVLKVALATRFPPQPESLRFRIPLTARNQ